MAPEEILGQLCFWMVNFFRQPYTSTFCLVFILFSPLWIRILIQEIPEYRSNLDPDPQHCKQYPKMNRFSQKSTWGRRQHAEHAHQDLHQSPLRRPRMRQVAARLQITILKMTTHATSVCSSANHNIKNYHAWDEWLLACQSQYRYQKWPRVR